MKDRELTNRALKLRKKEKYSNLQQCLLYLQIFPHDLKCNGEEAALEEGRVAWAGEEEGGGGQEGHQK